MPKLHWTPDDEARLRALYRAGQPPRDVAAQMGRSLAAVKTRASTLGITQQAGRWSPDEDRQLRGAVGVPRATLAAQLGRSVNAVLARAKLLGVSRPRRCRICGEAIFRCGLCHACYNRKTLGGRFSRSRAVSSGGVSVPFLVSLFDAQKGRCAYTGRPMEVAHGDDCVTVDRIDSSRPYCPGNVVLCCLYANTMKNDRTVEVFRQWCRAVARWS
jgi:hypothetical protein